MTSVLKSQQGFSLIELLVAITILAIGLLGIAGIQVQSLRYNAGANTRAVAISIAHGVMEEILSRSESDPEFASTATDIDWDLGTLPVAGTYTALYDITTNNPSNNVARVTVRVTGPNGRMVSMTNFKRFF